MKHPGLALACALLGLAGAVHANSAFSAGPYDGTYHGVLADAGGSEPNCAKRASIQITVNNNRLEYHHFSNATITTVVGQDGSFSGSATNRYSNGRGGGQVQMLTGRIAGDAIIGKTKVGTRCFYTLKLKRYS